MGWGAAFSVRSPEEPLWTTERKPEGARARAGCVDARRRRVLAEGPAGAKAPRRNSAEAREAASEPAGGDSQERRLESFRGHVGVHRSRREVWKPLEGSGQKTAILRIAF